MSASSFDRAFVISDPKSIKAFREALDNPIKVKVSKRDYEADSKRGVEMLRKWFEVN